MVKSKKKKKSGFGGKLTRWLSGSILILLPILVGISIAGYDANDPSFNMASNETINNYLGIFGATIANLIFVSFGIALPIFMLSFFFWGFSVIKGEPVWEAKYRIISFILGSMALSSLIASAGYTTVKGINLSGSFGKFISEKFMTFANTYIHFAYSKEVLLVFLAILALFFFDFACGITCKNWYSLIKKICKAFASLFVFLKSKLKRNTQKSKSAVKERKEPRFIASDDEEDEIQEEKKPRQVKEPTAKPATARVVKRTGKGDDSYQFPSLDLLGRPKKKEGQDLSEKELAEIAHKLEGVLQEFGVNGHIVKIRPGPVVTLFELEPAAGTKIARVIALADDIARSMSAVSVRIAVVSGSNTIGIELPNKKRETVWFKDLLEDESFSNTTNNLNIVLGKDIGGKNIYADLSRMPHLLVAGTTGSGKSVGVNSMILSLLYRMKPEEVRLIMVDPKMLEFSMYNGIPHLLTPVVTDPKKAVVALKWAVHEMEERNRAMAEMNVRNINGYNQKVKEMKASGKPAVKKIQIGFDADGRPLYEEQKMDLTPLPYIVIVVDEMADLMLVAGKEVEAAIQRLAQMARAAGIHLIMATQRPSVDVITGTIKANFPTRISFQVTSKIDSRTILGEQGAERLLGQGDMLYMPAGIRPIRVHGSFVKDEEVEAVVDFLKQQREPEYVEAVTQGELTTGQGSLFDDSADEGNLDLYNQAVQIVQKDKKASISYIQRRLNIGYNKAATLVEKMEENGVISAPDHKGKREVL